MGEQTIEIMIEGGKATPGPPIGTSLGPLRINVAQVVEQINEKTKDLAGMQVPVKIVVDTETKEFKIEVGTPPVAALIKKELKIEKGSGEAGTVRAGDLSEEQVRKIAKAKFGSEDEMFLSQIRGTCRSMGITIGQGAVTKEEIKRYEELQRQREEQERAKEEARVAGEAGEAKPEEAKEAEEAKPEAAEEKEAGEKPAEAPEKRPEEAKKTKEKG